MKNTIEEAELPEFPLEEPLRYQILFSGVVQGVGFRYETWRMAEKLGLTGFAENLPDGRVRAEVQGTKSKITYLLTYMQSIPRIQITDVNIKEISLKEEENFQAIY